MHWTASVLSTVSSDSEPALMINFDNAKYMFNAGENAVRSWCHSHTNRKKVKAAFFTQLGLERAGGMTGMLMTLADAGKVNDLNLVGPEGLMHRLACTRQYTYRPKLNINPIEIPERSVDSPPPTATPTPVYKDGNVSVYAYNISPTPTRDEPLIDSESTGSLKRKRDLSSEGPHKSLTSDEQDSFASGSEKVQSKMSDPNFKPTNLTGSLAQPKTKSSNLPEGSGSAQPPDDQLLTHTRTKYDRPKGNTKPIEIPSPPLTATATPVYKDGNVSVDAEALLDSESAGSPKRKRDSSPEGPRKRLSSDARGSPSNETLQNKMSEPNFKPSNLTGSLAAQWRELLVNTMFPDSRSLAKTKTSNLPKGTGSAQPADDYKRRKRLPKGYHDTLPPPDSPTLIKQAISYVLVGPAIRGKFDAPKALALGVPNGPLRGKLSNGHTVTFEVKDQVTGEDGQVTTVSRTVTVKPEDCIGPSFPRSAVIVLDVPSTEYIPHLLRSLLNEKDSLLVKLRSKKEEDRQQVQVKSVFHLVGMGVMDDPRYVDLMNQFGEDVQHIVASREFCPNPVTFTSAAANQVRLNDLDNDMFPIPKYDMDPPRQLSCIPNIPRHVHVMEQNQVVPIHPHGSPSKMEIALTKDYFHPLLAKKRNDGSIPVNLSPETRARFREAKDAVKQATGVAEKRPGDDVVVVPLGTGSAIPGQYRTVSSTLVMIPGWGNILLDAGEGTYFQLARHFGAGGVNEVMRNLKCMFISHAHADHLMGAAMVLRKRLELNPPPEHPLYLVTIQSVHRSLQEYQQLDNLNIHLASPSDPLTPAANGVIPVLSEGLHFNRPGQYVDGYYAVYGDKAWHDVKRTSANAAEMRKALGLRRVATVNMQHGTRCYGLVLWHKDGWSIAFSGDTEPTESLVRAAQGVTLLIHEATMSDDQAELARAKKHSTFGEAIDIGKRMNADKILLTHFSARHPKVPMQLLLRAGTPPPEPSTPSSPGASKTATKPVVALAFDQTNIRLGDMWKMEHYLPALEQNHTEMAAVDGDGEDEDMERLRMEL